MSCTPPSSFTEELHYFLSALIVWPLMAASCLLRVWSSDKGGAAFRKLCGHSCQDPHPSNVFFTDAGVEKHIDTPHSGSNFIVQFISRWFHEARLKTVAEISFLLRCLAFPVQLLYSLSEETTSRITFTGIPISGFPCRRPNLSQCYLDSTRCGLSEITRGDMKDNCISELQNWGKTFYCKI